MAKEKSEPPPGMMLLPDVNWDELNEDHIFDARDQQNAEVAAQPGL